MGIFSNYKKRQKIYVYNEFDINKLKQQIISEIKSDIDVLNGNFEQFKTDINVSFENFQTQVIECLVNNFNGVAEKIAFRPCDINESRIKTLEEQMNETGQELKRIADEVKQLKNERVVPIPS